MASQSVGLTRLVSRSVDRTTAHKWFDMKFIIAFLFAIVSVRLANFSEIAQKFGHISDCFFYNGSGHKVTLICDGRDNEHRVFAAPDRTVCLNTIAMNNDWPQIVHFENCQLKALRVNFFILFPNIQTFIASDVGLRTLQIHIFREGKQLRHLIASNNNLTEFPSRLFADENQIAHVDVSYNSIKRVDRDGLHNAKCLTVLNLSHNQIARLDSNFFYHRAPNLAILDVSHNNLRNLSERIFVTSAALRQLDMSYNFIGNLKFGTFSSLVNLEYLNLRHINMTHIHAGTFTYQRHLNSLNLAENKLKRINFDLAMASHCHLRALRLGRNHLRDLKGLRTALFPRLKLLDIQNNRFNCTYLQSFMKNQKWEKLHFVTESNANASHPRQPNVRGIHCEIVPQNGTDCPLQSEQKNKF